MLVEKNVPLQPYNSFHIVAKALNLLRIRTLADLQSVAASPQWSTVDRFVLGGGSNIVLTGDVKPLVLKIEIKGIRLVQETAKAWTVEAGAGEIWHDVVAWTLQNGYPGLENLALIPGTVGGAPVQNIGAYGVELQDRFESLDAFDLQTGQSFSLNAAQCGFGYRDSVFKHTPARPGVAEVSATAASLGLAGRAVITAVRFNLPKRWQPVLDYADLARKLAQFAGPVTGQAGDGNPDGPTAQPTPQQVFDWVCDIRKAKLPDPAIIGNAGSFFKNPSVSSHQCQDIIAREPRIVHYKLANGSVKLAAGWLIEACGWKGKSVGQAGVYEKQALVLVNRGTGTPLGATGGEVMTLARAIQTSVYERFGIRLEHEPVVV